MSKSMEKSSTRPGPDRNIRRRLYLVQVGANLTGAMLCIFYFTVLDPPEVAAKLDWHLLVSLIMTIGLMILGATLGLRYQAAMTRAHRALVRGEPLPPETLRRVQRRVINAPLGYSLITMGTWVIASLIIGGERLLFGDDPASPAVYEALRVFVGILVSGLATASIVFFATDSLFRRTRPDFFPEGGLVQVESVFRLKVRYRLLFAFMMVSVVPMIVVGVLFHHKITTALEATPQAALAASQQAALTSVTLAVIFVPAVLIVLAVILSRLVSTSIAGPVQEMDEAMARVREGDLSAQVTINNNDELGDLADAFNLMIAGLRERDFIKETFGKYVTREIRDEILAGRIPLDGVIREVTVMFADLRDFTPLVEATPPKDVVRVVNGYFEAMTPAIREHGGLVLQFLGDEIYAVFGAPLSLEGHARQAVAAAVDMRRRLAEVNDGLARRGIAPLRHGIGIHTGQVLAANIGSPDRLSYLLVGDTVNLASRIQGLTKEFKTDILVSAATRAALDPALDLRPLPATTVKGKSRP
ncbi:MAG: HAMP domain-containing protein, partial [Proteobacteria bacterium]|nr:HAMP domain-containing protein [Pseudomonadota bacterium]